jgi:CheY-like chemotaxis protein
VKGIRPAMNNVCDQTSLTHAVPSVIHHGPKRILVVDDDSFLCGLVAATLEEAGHQVKTAADGEAAWGALLASHYDLLVTDHLMPKASGLALVRRIRLVNRVLPIIVVSEKLDAADVLKLSRDPWQRFDTLIRKPFTMSELLAAVHSQPLFPDVGLAEQVDFRIGAAVEASFHRGEGGALMARHHLRLGVAGGKSDQDGGGEADGDPGPQEEPGLPGMLAAQGIPGADRSHDESARHQGAI